MKVTKYTHKQFTYSSHRIICDLLNKYHPQTILDIGCSDGFLAQEINFNPQKLIGLDINEPLNLPQEYTRFICLDIEDSTKSYSSLGGFEALVLADILEHLKSPEKTFQKFLPNLRPSGFLIISVPNMDFFLVKFFDLFKFRPKFNRTIFDKTHISDFNELRLLQIIKSNHLKVISKTYTPIPLPLIFPVFNQGQIFSWLYKLIFKLTLTFPQSFSYQIIVVATRKKG